MDTEKIVKKALKGVIKASTSYSDYEDAKKKIESYADGVKAEFVKFFVSDLIKDLKSVNSENYSETMTNKLTKDSYGVFNITIFNLYFEGKRVKQKIELAFQENSSGDLEIYTTVNGMELRDNKPRSTKELASQINRELLD